MTREPRFTEADLQRIRDSLAGLSEKRRRHILEVERMALRIGAVYLPDRRSELILRAAALLHDVTKEYTPEQHTALLEQYGIAVSDIELAAPKTLHAISAAALIPDRYPLFALPEVISAVRWHTTGRAGMSLYEKIVYLADYIDESRTYPDCVRLREMFWGPDPASLSSEQKERHLTEVLIASFDCTVRGLLEDGFPVHPATNEARNRLIADRRAAL